MNWPNVPFEEIYTIPSRNGVYKSKEFHGRGCRIVNMGELFGFDFISNQGMNRVELKESELSNNLLVDGDLLFGRRSLIESGAGKCSLVISPGDDLTFESSIIRVRLNKEIVNPRYFFYYFKSPQGRGRVGSIVSGTNVKGIRGSDLKKLSIPIPPKEHQDTAVDILSAYDDLIENNNRQIQLLEEAARQLYKEWFVHLRFPGHEQVKVVNGVPEGWEQIALENALTLQRGFDLPIQARKYGNVPIYGSTGIVGHHNQAKVNAPGVVTGRSGTLGQVHYTHDDYWPLNTSLWVKEFKRVSPFFAFFLLRELDLKKYNGGVSVPTLDRNVVHRIECFIPPLMLINEFDSFAGDIFAQIKKITLMNQKLQEARDLLLPRLMSGEIRV